MHRRNFLATLGVAAVASKLGACATSPAMSKTPAATPNTTPGGGRTLKSVGIQLYSLRDDAARDLNGTLAAIAAMGYKEVELLSSMKNFNTPPAQLRATLDRLGLRSPSTHIGAEQLDNMSALFDEANTLGHEYIVLASLPYEPGKSTPDDYRRWSDRLNDAGRQARARNLWIAFHDEAYDFRTVDGQVLYDILADRTDPTLVRLQLDTGNAAIGGRDPMDLMRKYGSRYYLFHIKDAPSIPAEHDAELGKGVLNFRQLLSSVPDIDNKHLYVEQETYPTNSPMDSARRDYAFISTVQF